MEQHLLMKLDQMVFNFIIKKFNLYNHLFNLNLNLKVYSEIIGEALFNVTNSNFINNKGEKGAAICILLGDYYALKDSYISNSNFSNNFATKFGN